MENHTRERLGASTPVSASAAFTFSGGPCLRESGGDDGPGCRKPDISLEDVFSFSGGIFVEAEMCETSRSPSNQRIVLRNVAGDVLAAVEVREDVSLWQLVALLDGEVNDVGRVVDNSFGGGFRLHSVMRSRWCEAIYDGTPVTLFSDHRLPRDASVTLLWRHKDVKIACVFEGLCNIQLAFIGGIMPLLELSEVTYAELQQSSRDFCTRIEAEISGVTWKDCLLRRVIDELCSAEGTKAMEFTGREEPCLVIHFHISWDGRMSSRIERNEGWWRSSSFERDHICLNLLSATEETFADTVVAGDLPLSQSQQDYLKRFFI